LSKRGETCNSSTDCESGLVCLPLATGAGAAGLGRCDFEDYGLTPTNKVCWAECREAADCCELPTSVMGENLRSCADLMDTLGDSPASCETSAPPDLARECFLYKTYCDCGASTWSCDSGTCSYTKACERNGEAVKGCPLVTRADRATPTATCDVVTNTCVAVAAVDGCRTDAECDGDPVADDATDSCTQGECVCITKLGACYRRCDNTLDCARGFDCDLSKKICVATGSCDTDEFCARTMNDVTATCVEHTCRLPCATDHDCNGSGLAGTGSFAGLVCENGYCQDLGCSSDAECAVADGVKLFCDLVTATPGEAAISSAITD